MTDPKARDNFAKYGNPDGYGNFQVGIALPQTISEKEYQILVLVAFFILITIVMPGYFYLYFNKEEKDVGGVDLKNRKVFAQLIDENMMGKVIPGILCQSHEFQEKVRVRTRDELEKMKELKTIPEF